ncbi:MAG: hypothetical protein QOH01_3148 [Verrucomicrobiota bacterium]|jgi:hypothetical protein
MPENRFPDSVEKRELRRRDARRIRQFAAAHGLTGLQYCGMPSVEYLDVLEWRESLSDVLAIESDPDVLSDMRIQWARIARDVQVNMRWHEGDILDYLTETSETYDLYNLDFYGGFLYPSERVASRCTTALRKLISNQGRAGRSFLLVTTFNLKDKGLDDYLRLADDIPGKLVGWGGVSHCIASHKAKGHPGLLKLCYPYFCWDTGRSENFRVSFETPYYYQKKTNLMHFCAEFVFESSALQPLFSTSEFAELMQKPIKKLDGQVPKAYLTPPAIVPPGT